MSWPASCICVEADGCDYFADGTRHLDGEPGTVAGICVSTSPRIPWPTRQQLGRDAPGLRNYNMEHEAIAHAKATAVVARRRFGLGLIAVIAALMVSVWFFWEVRDGGWQTQNLMPMGLGVPLLGLVFRYHIFWQK